MAEVEFGVQCQPDVAEELASSLSAATGSEVDQLQVNNLDGSPPTVLQVMQVAVSMIGVIAPIVNAYVAARKVKKIKLGDVEIENPSPEQWRDLWKEHISEAHNHSSNRND